MNLTIGINEYLDEAEERLAEKLDALTSEVLPQIKHKVSGGVSRSRRVNHNLEISLVLCFYLHFTPDEDEGLELGIIYQHTPLYSYKPNTFIQPDFNHLYIWADVAMLGKNYDNFPELQQRKIVLQDNPKWKADLDEVLFEIEQFIKEQKDFIISELNNF